MTGNEFINFIRSKGSFVRPEDMESLVSFYESRLLTASSADEEEQMVASFGDPNTVICRLKEQYVKLGLPTESAPSPDEENNDTSSPSQEDQAQTEEEDEDVRIFSAQTEEEFPPLAPSTPSAPSPSDASSALKKNTRRGIVDRLLDRMKLKGKQRAQGAVVLTVFISPVFVLLALGIAVLFLLAMAGITLLAAVLMLVEGALILICVVELIYAILSFFTSVPIALIELGLGTVLVSLVVAVTALVYQLLTGVIPVAAKNVNRLRKRAFRGFFELFYGRKGGRA